jgi:branched-chain amino acid transport system permease protein
MMIILGGIRSLGGPLLGALLFVGLQDIISSYTEHWMFVIGILFMIIVLYFPRGILGSLSLRLKK